MKDFKRIKDYKTLQNYKLWLSFDDGISGEVDLSSKVGKGVFKLWEDFGNFSKVKLSDDRRSLNWNEDLDLCADSLYIKATGITEKQLFE